MALVAPRESRHRTKQEFVYMTLRQAIIGCDLPPGERLIIEEVARQLRVSAIPVREALQLLQSDGFVVNVPHVGATVAPVSRESVVDVFTVLEGLESVAVRHMVRRATAADVDGLAEFVSRMDEAVATGELDSWSTLNRRFHLRISVLTDLPMLQDMTVRVFDRWERVRRFYFRDVLMHRVEQAQAEHTEMLAAMRAGAAAELETLVRRHNQGALAAYLARLGADAA
jgi:DNA-binding GntR family transcriptional regulator